VQLPAMAYVRALQQAWLATLPTKTYVPQHAFSVACLDRY